MSYTSANAMADMIKRTAELAGMKVSTTVTTPQSMPVHLLENLCTTTVDGLICEAEINDVIKHRRLVGYHPEMGLLDDIGSYTL